MADKEIYDWIKRALDHITGFIEAVDKRLNELVKTVQDCRKHCDHCREVCSLKDDHETRIRTLEATREKMRGACDAKKELWYKDPHWWHSAGAWVAIGAALWMGARGGLH